MNLGPMGIAMFGAFGVEPLQVLGISSEHVGNPRKRGFESRVAQRERRVGQRTDPRLGATARLINAGSAMCDCTLCGLSHFPDTDNPHRAIAIASEPMTGETWHEVQEGSTIAVDE